jgi:hypothetical protein
MRVRGGHRGPTADDCRRDGAGRSVLWRADHEMGTSSHSSSDGWGRISISSPADVRPTTAHARSGWHSLALTIRTAARGATGPAVQHGSGRRPGKPLPADAY